MSIENNYEGPPSLKIYQEFVQASTVGAVDQNAVIVAQHYDIHTMDNASNEDIKTYSSLDTATYKLPWNAVDGQSMGVNPDTHNVDTKSIKLHFTDAEVVQGSLEGVLAENGGNELRLTDADLATPGIMPEVVMVGDTVSVTCGANAVIGSIIAIEKTRTQAPATINNISGKVSVLSLSGTNVAGDMEYYIEATEVNTDDVAGTSVVFSVTSQDGDFTDTITMKTGDTKNISVSGLSATLGDASDVVVGDKFVVKAYGERYVLGTVIINREVTGKAADTVVIEFCKKRSFSVDLVMTTSDGVIIADKGGLTVDTTFGKYKATDAKVLCGSYIVEYRALNKSYIGKLGYADNSTISVVGDNHVNNPLGAMVHAALKGGKGVYFTAVADDTVSSYSKAFSLLSRSTNTYGVVIGTTNKDVILEAAEFVEQCADPDVANYKILYYGLDASREKCVMDKVYDSDDIEYKAVGTIANGVLTLTNNSVTGFITNGVLASDVIVYDNKRYTVKEIHSNKELVLTDATVNSDFEYSFKVYRTLSGMGLVDELKSRVYTKSHRCYCVFGDGISVDGIENAPAWLLAALPAGMRAGEYCQRPISNLSYTGVEAENRLELNAAELRMLASRGVWILANSADGKQVFNYHQLSTDMSSKKLQEQSYTTNFDNISRGARALMLPYYGNSNISQEFLNQLHANLGAYLSGKETNAPSVEIGPQLISYENLKITQDDVNKDRVYMEVDYNMPAPFNHVVLRQRLI